MPTDVVGYSYAAFVTAAGAYQAYFTRMPSLLLLGGVYGGFATLGAYNTSQNSDDLVISKLTSFGHTATMFALFSDKRKLLPFAAIGVVSMLVCTRCFLIKPFVLRESHH